jgi:pimeloyl-ACP methyl ester carboxylesterase
LLSSAVVMTDDTETSRLDATRTAHPSILPADDGGAGGPAVVFLHSLGGRETQWLAQLAHVRPNRRALALTLRGHVGAPGRGNFAISLACGDVLRTLDLRGVERFVAVGHGVGAWVAVECASVHPERVVGLLLVDASAGLVEVEERWEALLAGARPAVRDAVIGDLRATPPETLEAGARAASQFDPVAALRAYPGPVLSVTTARAEGPLALHELVPKIRHERLEGTSHWLFLDKPDEFNRMVDEFIVETQTPSRRAAAAPSESARS